VGQHPAPVRRRDLQFVADAKLIALACSKPPKGRARWTLRLLENKVVELGIDNRPPHEILEDCDFHL
jgi:hypothetical protein